MLDIYKMYFERSEIASERVNKWMNEWKRNQRVRMKYQAWNEFKSFVGEKKCGKKRIKPTRMRWAERQPLSEGRNLCVCGCVCVCCRNVISRYSILMAPLIIQTQHTAQNTAASAYCAVNGILPSRVSRAQQIVCCLFTLQSCRNNTLYALALTHSLTHFFL